eukprot:c11695_g1_i1.p2 GENE.c11695_g1_i1~~c11695_g1_i1.p2  ORF type:complete len:186 (+),score=39.64 c11695_g1_i1:71-628(+)
MLNSVVKIKHYVTREIQKHIVQTTHSLTPGPNSITEKEIVASFVGINLPSLTLIDLPGHIVHHAENPSLPNQINDLIVKYLEHEQATILAVHDVGVDEQNDPVLAMILGKIDPLLLRTIIVLTKMDRVQKPQEMERVIKKKKIQTNQLFSPLSKTCMESLGVSNMTKCLTSVPFSTKTSPHCKSI